MRACSHGRRTPRRPRLGATHAHTVSAANPRRTFRFRVCLSCQRTDKLCCPGCNSRSNRFTLMWCVRNHSVSVKRASCNIPPRARAMAPRKSTVVAARTVAKVRKVSLVKPPSTRFSKTWQMESFGYKLLAIKVDLEAKTVEETWLHEQGKGKGKMAKPKKPAKGKKNGKGKKTKPRKYKGKSTATSSGKSLA